MSTYMMMPKDYARELMRSGKRDKARCFFEYVIDVEDNKINSIRFYANAWDKQRTVVERWVNEFKKEIVKHHEFWAEKNKIHAINVSKISKKHVDSNVDSNVDSHIDTKQPNTSGFKAVNKNTNVDTLGTACGQSINKEYKESKRVQSKFVSPTLKELEAYSQEQNLVVDIEKFFKYYTATDWKDNKGKSVKNWKLKLITWSTKSSPKQTSLEDMPMEERIIVAERQRQAKIKEWEVANGF